ncbi:hypothetical protein BDN72DRAFT_173154 [Pluteus cervinus]|uniref:Uncharacterized protein n=1 Tax=Pluteus cervinus TaxID=181527 RepID=A0ACD3AKF3_9AGAR|nr:hypothetical protein BDN72DRAFT_173154 [Pluteus cervinus]
MGTDQLWTVERQRDRIASLLGMEQLCDTPSADLPAAHSVWLGDGLGIPMGVLEHTNPVAKSDYDVSLQATIAIKYYWDSEGLTPKAVPFDHLPYSIAFPDSEEGHATYFECDKALAGYPLKSAYLAHLKDKPDHKLIVKFVRQYGVEVHRILAEKGNAPKLHYFGPLTTAHGSTSSESTGPYRMVVMDYVEEYKQSRPSSQSAPHIPEYPGSFLQIQSALEDLHRAGLVLGDLRREGIRFDKNGVVKFLNFEWAGRYDRKVIRKLSRHSRFEVVPGPENGESGSMRYPKLPSTDCFVDGQGRPCGWPNGVEDFAEVRPEHDNAMLLSLPESYWR